MKENDILFWGEDPNIILQKNNIFEFFPIENMSFNQKLNALTRTILLLTLFLFIFTRSPTTLLMCIFTLVAIYILHQSSTNEEGFSENDETFIEEIELNKTILEDDSNKDNPALDYIRKENVKIEENAFQLPSSKNPLSNVLITDYTMNPNKRPAPPATNASVKANVMMQAKKLVQEANPHQPDINEKLFKDLHEKLNFEQSLRSYNSTSNTTIPNDQGAFADFCYGSMSSCKDGNLFDCSKTLSNNFI